VRIPADVEHEDRLLAGLTARQLAILGVAGVLLWAAYDATRHLVPIAAFAAVAAPFAVVATGLALGRMDGMSADRLVVAAWRQRRAPRHLVPAPEGVASPPAFLGIDPGPLPAPLRLPIAGVEHTGVIDLGADGQAVICRATAVTFSLRTPVEQEALVASFARFLSSLAEPVQILVRAEPVDLTPTITELLTTAPGLPHSGLEAAAREHARFLSELCATADLLRREVLVVLRQPVASQSDAHDASVRLRRRADEAAAALAAAGVSLVVLDAAAASACLTRSLDPAAPPRPEGTSATTEVVSRAPGISGSRVSGVDQ
jgi:hypothetical protein